MKTILSERFIIIRQQIFMRIYILYFENAVKNTVEPQ